MHLTIIKSGIINGGYADYTYNQDTLTFMYSGEIKISVGFIHKTQPFSGNCSVPLKDMQSCNIDVGEVIQINGHTMTCTSINGIIAIFSISENNFNGEITVKIDQPIISIIGCNIDVKYSGISATIIAHN